MKMKKEFKHRFIVTLVLLNSLFLFNASFSQDLNQPTKDKKKGNPAHKGNQQGKGRNRIEEFDINKLDGNLVLGCPTDKSIVLNIISTTNAEIFVDYGTSSGKYEFKTKTHKSNSTDPVEIFIENLTRNQRYFYRINTKHSEKQNFTSSPEKSFTTQRDNSSTFTFGVQGDSHPERLGKMFDPELYFTTMKNVSESHPDFYFLMGDDFSIDRLIGNNQVNKKSIENVYCFQRQFLTDIGGNSPLFLVNGNHEQAAKYLIDGTVSNPAVLAANARIKYYPLPSPNNFYSGDNEKIENVGFLKDYYSFEWGNALFIVIDPYWHSESAVDNIAGSKDKKNRNLWDVTLGEDQYQWFKQTLENSQAKFKFVFCHHVLGTGRGGIERAKLFEWGGYNQQGIWEFDKMRPNWKMPIHQLMVQNKVTIFFQGHDHLFAKQELDGVIYQSVPNPADNTYTAFNADAYQSGDTLPNSGFLKIIVSPSDVKVDYIRSFLSKDETGSNKNGVSAYSYKVK
jgi:hypothetical protein